MPLVDRALGQQTQRPGPGALSGPSWEPFPLPCLAAMRGRWRGLSRGRRPPLARNPRGPRPPSLAPSWVGTQHPLGCIPAPRFGGERGRSHLPSSPLLWRPPSPGHRCDGNRGSCQRRLGVWEPLLIGFMCESPPAQPSVSLNTPPGPAPAPLHPPSSLTLRPTRSGTRGLRAGVSECEVLPVGKSLAHLNLSPPAPEVQLCFCLCGSKEHPRDSSLPRRG